MRRLSNGSSRGNALGSKLRHLRKVLRVQGAKPFDVVSGGRRIAAATSQTRFQEYETEARVLSQVGTEEPVHLDALVRRAGLTQAPLLNVLLSLELRRLIRSVPGGRFLRAADLPGSTPRSPLFSEN